MGAEISNLEFCRKKLAKVKMQVAPDVFLRSSSIYFHAFAN